MGKVRPEHIKKVARDLLNRYPDKFTTKFEENKKILETVARVHSTRVLNRIAGYITRLMAIRKHAETTETTEEKEATVSEEA